MDICVVVSINVVALCIRIVVHVGIISIAFVCVAIVCAILSLIIPITPGGCKSGYMAFASAAITSVPIGASILRVDSISSFVRSVSFVVSSSVVSSPIVSSVTHRGIVFVAGAAQSRWGCVTLTVGVGRVGAIAMF